MADGTVELVLVTGSVEDESMTWDDSDYCLIIFYHHNCYKMQCAKRSYEPVVTREKMLVMMRTTMVQLVYAGHVDVMCKT